MLFMDLLVDDQPVFYGQPCFGQTFLRDDLYIGLPGLLIFVDSQGFDTPTWEGLNTRFLLAYLENGQPIQTIPCAAVPNQNLVVELGGHFCTIGLYDLPIDEDTAMAQYLPVGATDGYKNQAFLAAPPVVSTLYVAEGYWVEGYVV